MAKNQKGSKAVSDDALENAAGGYADYVVDSENKVKEVRIWEDGEDGKWKNSITFDKGVTFEEAMKHVSSYGVNTTGSILDEAEAKALL